MNLQETLSIAIKRGLNMTRQIAAHQFGDDSPEKRIISRRWGIEDAAALVGMSPQAIRNAEKDGRLPQPEMEQQGRVARRAGYSIEQINYMREVFNTLPRRPDDKPPVVVGIAAHKGGAYKTSSAVHLAQWLALMGYRVLLVDATDPQATASLYHGYVPDIHVKEQDTLLPYYLGERSSAEYAIKRTGWPTLDIIPGCLALHRMETEVNPLYDAGKIEIPPHMLLRGAIESVYENYDVVVVDSAPNLGLGAINVVCASDILIVPTPAELNDYVSTLQFFSMMHDLVSTENIGQIEPVVKILITKYSTQSGSQSDYMGKMIRGGFGDMVLQHVVKVTDEVGKGQVKMRTVFEQATYQRSSLGAWRNALAIWEPVCKEILDDLIKPFWEAA